VPGSQQTTSLRYFHYDQLGSVAAVTDEVGSVIERIAYDPWGKRRGVDGVADVTDSLVGRTTDRGFTEHEHLDEVGVVHMNGRIYDPLVGRFMSADPFIQAPSMLQSYNRYAYVMNNPLNLTDPSGYWSLGGFLRNMDTFTRHPSSINAFNAHRSVPGVVSLDNFVVKHPWAFQIGRAAAGAWGGPWAAAGATGYYTYLMTGCESCSVKAFGRSIATSYAFKGAGDVGDGVDAEGVSNQYGVGHYAAHAAVGCVSSAASGGQCGAGALSAVAGLAGEQIGGAIGAGTAGRFATSVVAGGIASRLAGGSFMDGAQTAAYGYLFNCMRHEICAGKSATATDVRGGFNSKGESLVYHPDNYNPGAASEILITGAFAIVASMPADALRMIEFSAMSTAELMGVIAANGTNKALNAGGLFGSGVSEAQAALRITEVPANINRTLLLAYREIATRNIAADIQQIRIQVIDRVLGMIK
jgi:RHS repeat-associated protein